MKNIKIKSAILITSIFLLLVSCYLPSPLYGTWSDNTNTLKFFNDGTFSGTIVEAENKKVTYSGSYNVIDNVIVFIFKEPETNQKNAEWDIRGAMLYLDWTDSDGTKKQLTLAHTAR